MGEKSSKRLSFLATNNAHRLSDGLHTIPSSLTVRKGEMMIETSPSHQFAGSDHPNTLQLIDRNSACMNSQYQRTTIVAMNDDEFVTTPTKRPRGNSVLEESLLNAGMYLRRKFSYGSSD